MASCYNATVVHEWCMSKSERDFLDGVNFTFGGFGILTAALALWRAIVVTHARWPSRHGIVFDTKLATLLLLMAHSICRWPWDTGGLMFSVATTFLLSGWGLVVRYFGNVVAKFHLPTHRVLRFMDLVLVLCVLIECAALGVMISAKGNRNQFRRGLSMSSLSSGVWILVVVAGLTVYASRTLQPSKFAELSPQEELKKARLLRAIRVLQCIGVMIVVTIFSTLFFPPSAQGEVYGLLAVGIVEIVAVFFGIFLVGRVPRRFLAEMQTSVTSPSGPGAQQAWSPGTSPTGAHARGKSGKFGPVGGGGGGGGGGGAPGSPLGSARTDTGGSGSGGSSGGPGSPTSKMQSARGAAFRAAMASTVATTTVSSGAGQAQRMSTTAGAASPPTRARTGHAMSDRDPPALAQMQAQQQQQQLASLVQSAEGQPPQPSRAAALYVATDADAEPPLPGAAVGASVAVTVLPPVLQG